MLALFIYFQKTLDDWWLTLYTLAFVANLLGVDANGGIISESLKTWKFSKAQV